MQAYRKLTVSLHPEIQKWSEEHLGSLRITKSLSVFRGTLRITSVYLRSEPAPKFPDHVGSLRITCDPGVCRATGLNILRITSKWTGVIRTWSCKSCMVFWITRVPQKRSRVFHKSSLKWSLCVSGHATLAHSYEWASDQSCCATHSRFLYKGTSGGRGGGRLSKRNNTINM
jgi:hypothetical protein